MRGSKEDPFSKSRPDAGEQRQPFDLWVGSRKCLFLADGRCAGTVEALELDFAAAAGSVNPDPLLIPVCEVHRRDRWSKGWEAVLQDLALNPADLANAANLLRSRWNGRPFLSTDPSS